MIADPLVSVNGTKVLSQASKRGTLACTDRGMDGLLTSHDYRRVLAVVEVLERAPTVAALRAATLAALEEEFGYGSSTFFVAGPPDVGVELLDGSVHGHPLRDLEEFLERWAPFESLSSPVALAKAQANGVVELEEVYDRLEPGRRRYVNEFLLPKGIGSQLGLFVDTGLRANGYMALLAPRGESFGRIDRTRMLALRPHLANHLRSRLLIECGEPLGLKLSPRQRQVAGLVAAGLSNAELAGELGIAENTVKKHVSAILRKTELRSRAQIAASWGAFAGQAERPL